MKIKLEPCCLGLLTAAFTITACQADILTLIGPTVNNGSFELLGGVTSAAKAKHWDSDPAGDVTNWTLWPLEATASNDSGVETAGNATNGTKRGFLQNGNAVYNLTTRLAAAGDNYTMAWDHIAGTGAPVTGWIVYDDGGTITKILATQVISAAGGVRRTFSYAIPAGSPAIGKAIGVGFKSNGGWPALDNVVLTLPTGDNDGDGLQNDWEVANGLDPNSSVGVNGAAGDPDNDGLTNLAEFNAGTKANDSDSDDDGLPDGLELSGTSNLFDGTPTDPLDADSDDDGLLDGQENGSSNTAFSNQPSDPHAADTDADGFPDAAEISYRTNPANAASIPYLLTLIGPTANNGSFELLNGFANTAKAPHWDTAAAGDVTDWTLWPAESTAENDSGTEVGGATNGTKKGFLQNGNAVYNMTTRPAQAGEIYAFSWDHTSGSGAPLTGWLVYNDGGTITKILASEIVSTTAGTHRELYYTIPAGSPAIGKIIGTGFKSTGNWPGLDNVVLTVPTADADGDGMSNDYEVANGLNPNSAAGANGAAGDPDNDGLTNFQEMAAGTRPNHSDTDGDGLQDGPELAGTSNLFDGSPTDPLDADSDDDRISDGQENGTLNDAFSHQATDPHSGDTDADTIGDAAEFVFRTNPNDVGSKPFLSALIGPNANNGSFEQLSGSVNLAKATHWDSDPDGDVTNWTLWTGESTAENDSGAEVGATATLGTKRAFLQWGNAVYNMTTRVVQAGDIYSLTWDHIAGSGSPLLAWMVYNDNGTITKLAETQVVSLNGGVRREFVYSIPAGSPAIGKTIGAGFRSAGLWPGLDNVVLAFPALDTDGDGMPDDWEAANGLNPNSNLGPNGATGDPDHDGLNNLAEFNTGTRANDNDSDDDGALDGAEVAGTSNVFDGTPTDPLDSDSDDDGVLDGQENGGLNATFANAPTDPHAADSDVDGFPDGKELFYHSNPADSTSVPALITLIGPEVKNGSFEVLDGPDNAAKATHWDADADGNVPDWTVWPVVSTAENDSGTETGATSNGSRRAFLQNGNAVFNMTSRLAQAGEIYALSWDHTGGGGPLTAWITYHDGGMITKIPATEKISPDRGNGREFIYTIPAGSPAIGKKIGVGFKSTGDYPNLDNVVLTLANAQSGGPDSDNDGMEDTWETFWFGGLNETPVGDFDHDGTDNGTEFLLGLLPASSRSRFSAGLNAALLLQWPSVTGVTFTVQRTTTLEAGGWSNIATVPGTAGTAGFTDPSPPAARAYYRVKLNQ